MVGDSVTKVDGTVANVGALVLNVGASVTKVGASVSNVGASVAIVIRVKLYFSKDIRLSSASENKFLSQN